MMLSILLSLYVLLALINPLLADLNRMFRRFINKSRDLRLRPLMIFTHRWNDGPLLSLQVILIAMILGLITDNWRRAMVLSSAMFLQTTLVSVTKKITAVNRPPQDLTHRIMKSGSYPSGHTAAALTFALLVPPVLSPYISTLALVLLSVYLAFNAVLTAYGRLYLDVHWLSDIVGAVLLSLATRLAGSFFL
jgi:membrane-associated phospholipid phosphatase